MLGEPGDLEGSWHQSSLARSGPEIDTSQRESFCIVAWRLVMIFAFYNMKHVLINYKSFFVTVTVVITSRVDIVSIL